MLKKIMDKLFVMQQKSILLTEKKKLESQLKKTGKFPEYGDSEEDNTQEVEEFVDNLGLEKSLLKHYREVNTALRKIEEDKYGYCDNCHEIIDKARLRAFPAATSCIKCSAKI